MIKVGKREPGVVCNTSGNHTLPVCALYTAHLSSPMGVYVYDTSNVCLCVHA